MNRSVAFLISLVIIASLFVMACAKPAPAPTPATPAVKPTPALAPATTHPIVTVPVWSGPFGGISYNIHMATEDIFKKGHPWLRLPAVETAGYMQSPLVHNDHPEEWGKSLIGSNYFMLYLCKNAVKPFYQTSIVGYRVLFQYDIQALWLLTLDPNIKTPQDLIGKRIALGSKSQLTWTTIPEILMEHAWGIKDKVDIKYLGGATQAAQAVIDGAADAFFAAMALSPTTGKPSKSDVVVRMEASGKKLYHIGLSNEEFARLQDNGWKNLPLIKVPAGAVSGLDKDINGVWSGSVGLAAKDVFPEDLAYEITKFMLTNINLLGQYSDQGKVAAKEASAYGPTKAGIHPGALRALEELGVKIPEK